MSSPPSESDEDACIFIDHRDDEESIVSAVAERISEELTPELDDEALYVVHAGERHRFPLQFSPHDRYIAISSLAMLLRKRYRFLLLKPSIDDDTQGLLVALVTDVEAWGELPEHLIPLDIGFDYFHDIRVPYLGGEGSAPNFLADRQQVQADSDAVGGFVDALFSGKMDESTAAKLAAMFISSSERSGSAVDMS